MPSENQKGVVYGVPCKDCRASYTGETLRTIEHRLKEHKRSTEKGDFTSSAAAEHAWQQNHTIGWEKAKVTDRETKTGARRVKEAMIIAGKKSRGEELMNKGDGLKLSAAWKSMAK